MKKSIKLLLLLAINICCFSSLDAQNIDTREMRPHLNILEGVLEEMFEIRRSAASIIVSESGEDISYGGNREAKGFFLPGYGVIFTISEPSTAFLTTGDEKNSYNFANGKKVTKETVINRVIHFLADYGSALDQLQNNDHIMVLFRGSVKADYIKVYNAYGAEVTGNTFQSLPVISIVAEVDNVKALSRNDISTDEFRERLSISIQEKDEKKSPDLMIMAKILKTALAEGGKNEFEINGDISYLKIDEFGALFSHEIAYGNPFGIISNMRIVDGELLEGEIVEGEVLKQVSNIKWDSLYNALSAIKLDSLAAAFAKIKWDSLFSAMSNSLQGMQAAISTIHLDSLEVKSPSVTVKKSFDTIILDSLSVSITKELAQMKSKVSQTPHLPTGDEEQKKTAAERKKNLLENTKESLSNFVHRLKELIVEYGPTLDSVSEDQRILFSVDVSSVYDELPERVVVQVQKSVLRAVERGAISEGGAMAKIDVRRIP